MSDLINFAHRGAAGYYPENTMLAFAKALELGATGIETDVQMTRDGELVLIHDETLQRTAGTPEWVKDLTLAEIKQREAGSWFREEFAGERIPTLEELLDLVRNTDTIVNLELKTGVVLYPGIEQKVLDTVRRFGLSERIIISSFNHYSLVECKKLAPDIRTGILYMEGLYEPWDYAKRGRGRAPRLSIRADARAGGGGQGERSRLSSVYGKRYKADAGADRSGCGRYHYRLPGSLG